MVVCANSCQSRSQFGLRARLTGLSGAASRQPTPSSITSRTGITEWMSDTTGRRRNGGIGWRANVGNPSDTLSFYLRPCAVLGFHCIPHAIHSEQLAADPGHDLIGRYAALAARRPSFFEGRRGRSIGRDSTHQSPECSDSRFARRQGLRWRTSAQRGAYSLVAAWKQRRRALQVDEPPADRLLRARQPQPRCELGTVQARLRRGFESISSPRVAWR